MKDFAEPWPNSRREPLIEKLKKLDAANTKAYQEVRKEIHWESPRLDRFVGRASRYANLIMALRTYKSDTIEGMKRGFVELDLGKVPERTGPMTLAEMNE